MLRVKVLRQDTEILYGRSKSCCKYLMDVFRKISMTPTSETFFVYPLKQKKLTKKIGKNEYQYFEGSSTIPIKGNGMYDCLLGKNEWWWRGRGQYSFHCKMHVRIGFKFK